MASITPLSVTPTTRPHRVVIIGAGYAGTVAANRILREAGRPSGGNPAATVTVVNPLPDFVERIRLHEVIAGSRPTATRPLSDLLDPRASIVTGTAVQIDADARVVHIETGQTTGPLAYDTLVYAVGSQARLTVPGAIEHALPTATAEDADRARERVASLPAGAPVVVVGGGLTGIEMASELAESRPDLVVTLLSGQEIGPGLGTGGRNRILRALDRFGVTVEPGQRVVAVQPDQLELADGRTIPFAACLWCASFGVPDLARRSGLATDGMGRLRVDETLASIDRPEIIGTGDAVAPPAEVGGHLRMSCASAMPLGGHAGDTVVARIRGDGPTPISIGYAGQCISLGRRDGVLQLVHRDDSPRGLSYGGRAGGWTKERICRYTIQVVRGERRRRNRFVPGPRRPETAARIETVEAPR